MRRQMVIGNWKMNLTVDESIRLVSGLKSSLSGKQDMDVIIAPDFVSLHPVAIAIQDLPFRLAAQDVAAVEKGAFTGEVSARMLSAVECEYVIVGHSERRRHNSENNETVRAKVKLALEQDLIPVVCVGETTDEREALKASEVVETQLQEILGSLRLGDGSDIVVAYEPVWAIGTGKSASLETINEMLGEVRRILASLFPNSIADQICVLYGGSVDASNASEIMHCPHADGLLVGSASLSAETFARIIVARDHLGEAELL